MNRQQRSRNSLFDWMGWKIIEGDFCRRSLKHSLTDYGDQDKFARVIGCATKVPRTLVEGGVDYFTLQSTSQLLS